MYLKILETTYRKIQECIDNNCERMKTFWRQNIFVTMIPRVISFASLKKVTSK